MLSRGPIYGQVPPALQTFFFKISGSLGCGNPKPAIRQSDDGRLRTPEAAHLPTTDVQDNASAPKFHAKCIEVRVRPIHIGCSRQLPNGLATLALRRQAGRYWTWRSMRGPHFPMLWLHSLVGLFRFSARLGQYALRDLSHGPRLDPFCGTRSCCTQARLGLLDCVGTSGCVDNRLQMTPTGLVAQGHGSEP